MKKAFLFLAVIAFLCLVGCQKEIIEQIEYDIDTDCEYYIETRARVPAPPRPPATPPIPTNVIASGEAHNLPDPIYQMHGMPVWIYLPEGVIATGSRRYLSAFPATNGIGTIELSANPNHVRTRWVLDYQRSSGAPAIPIDPEDRSSFSFRLRSQAIGNDAGFVTVPEGGLGEFSIAPRFERNATNSFIINLFDSPMPNRYRITSWISLLVSQSDRGTTRTSATGNLRAMGYGSNKLRFTSSSPLRGLPDMPFWPTDRYTYWGISPVETFDLIGMRYDFLPCSNSFTATPFTIRRFPITNTGNAPMQRTFTYSVVTTSESTFSRTNRITTNINTGANISVGTPNIIGGGINTSITTGNEWSFTNGGRETRTETFMFADVLTVPAHSTVTIELVGTEYRMNITYIATLRGRTTGRTIRLTGTWQSVLVQEVYARYIFPNGEVIQGVQLQRQNITRAIH